MREEFFRVGGYDDLGYGDDRSISQKLGKKASAAKGAICYHNNPGNLKKVFQSAKWLGKGELRKGFADFMRYSLLISFRTEIKLSRQTGDYHFLLFKTVYNLGMSTGMLQRLILP